MAIERSRSWRWASLAVLLFGGHALAQAPSSTFTAGGNSPSMAMSPSLGQPLNNMAARACVPDRGSPAVGWPEPQPLGTPSPPRAPLCSQGPAAATR
jgi:hypothetical protein